MIAQMVYEHPMFTPDSVATRRCLPALKDGVDRVRRGVSRGEFHEDGCRAGVAAAASLGAVW